MLIWPDIFDDNVRAFFTGKRIGAERHAIAALLDLSERDVILPLQEHTDRVWVVESRHAEPMIADAVVTDRRRLVIGVQVADCLPVLIYDGGTGVVGVVHAGWRGTAHGIIKKAIAVFTERFGADPRTIIVACGPSIRGSCYVVDADVKEAVVRATGPGDYVSPADGKYRVDLLSANVAQAVSVGVLPHHIWTSPLCTHCNPGDFHSYRYHRDYSGKQGGFIGML